MNVLVVGGAGYVGCKLVPALLAGGHHVIVHDLLLYGDNLPRGNKNLTVIKDDIRLAPPIWFNSIDIVIHLAWVPDGFERTVLMAKQADVRRFIFVSSSAVYGISDSQDVREDHPLVPITHYNTYKAECEKILLKHGGYGFEVVVLRPVTICGYSPRQRFDLLLNGMVNQAVNTGKITIVDGRQMRPNLHIDDMVDAIVLMLKAPSTLVDGQVFNIGMPNMSVMDLALSVIEEVGMTQIDIRNEVIDTRSYQINSNKIRGFLGFVPRLDVVEAVHDLAVAFGKGLLPNSLTDDLYYNERRENAMSEIDLHRMGKAP